MEEHHCWAFSFGSAENFTVVNCDHAFTEQVDHPFVRRTWMTWTASSIELPTVDWGPTCGLDKPIENAISAGRIG